MNEQTQTLETQCQHLAGELIVTIYKDLGFWEAQGFRATLESEGLVPADLDWPEGTSRRYWTCGRVEYFVTRMRPPGLKGPMRLWNRGDWWCVRGDLLNGPSPLELKLRRAIKDAQTAQTMLTAEGQRRHARHVDALMAAHGDAAFRAWCQKIPGLAGPGRASRNPGPPTA